MHGINLQLRCVAKQFAAEEGAQEVASEPHARKCHCTWILSLDVDFLYSACILQTLVGNGKAL